jgi:TetR/AcrR family transcriptional regulator
VARPPRVSPDRILAAAAGEFAARGYAGARVDRIARRARVNKAMLYYHFGSKQGLYRTLLRQTFGRAAERLHAIAASEAAPQAKIDLTIAGIAAFIGEHQFFPSIMLREIAEGGVHLDPETLAALAAIPLAVGDIVQQGVSSGEFRDIHPVAAYFTMVAPIIVYLAGAPIRKALSSTHLATMSALPPDAFVRHLQESMRLALSSHTAPRHDDKPSHLRGGAGRASPAGASGQERSAPAGARRDRREHEKQRVLPGSSAVSTFNVVSSPRRKP